MIPSETQRDIASENQHNWLDAFPDPVERLLLTGEVCSLHEAEERYLDSAYPEVLALLRSPLSNDELGRHPLMVLFRSHGSRPPEDSLL